MSDIVVMLRSLSRYEHADLSVGDEAADEIERLRGERDDLRRLVHAAERARDEAIADRDRLREELDTWKFAAETLGPGCPDQKPKGFPKRRRRAISEREGREG